MYPVLFTVGGFPVRAYGVAIILALCLALWVASRLARQQGHNWAGQLEDLVAWVLLGGVIGARIWEVAFSIEEYRHAPLHALAIWHGGLSIQGAIAGGLITALWFARRRRILVWPLLDTLAPAVVLAQGVGRLTACVLNGDAYGRPTGTAFGIVYPPGSPAYMAFGPQPLWPAEIFEGLWDLAVFALLLWMLRKQAKPGSVVLWYALLYSAGRFGLEFLRGDSLMVGGLKAAQVTSVIIALVTAAWLLLRRRALAGTAR